MNLRDAYSIIALVSEVQEGSKEIGFVFNPYDPCIANRMKAGGQHTVRFHVDD